MWQTSVSMGEHLDRQLAAVMFADMVGFTALMQEDEHLALQARAKYAGVLNAQHAAFGGRIVQYYGDGALTIFPNSLDAVRCAIEIQKELSQPPDVPARIGIHVGNVIVEPTGLIGDAVNIASRIESFGVPGGVLVSDSVHDQVRNQFADEVTAIENREFLLLLNRVPPRLYFDDERVFIKLFV